MRLQPKVRSFIHLSAEMRDMSNWAKELDIGVTVCDKEGIVLEMNDKASKIFAKSGGASLIGQSLFPCHGDASGQKLRNLMDAAQKNIYTIEKNGVKKMIAQIPWFRDGECQGMVELSLELPNDIPHFVRS